MTSREGGGGGLGFRADDGGAGVWPKTSATRSSGPSPTTRRATPGSGSGSRDSPPFSK